MADLNTDLQLYLKLNKINEVKEGSSTQMQVHDSSNHERHGIVQGNPMVVSDDRFGSCLMFDGDGDSIDCGSLDFARGSYTISAWFKTSSSSQIDIFAATETETNNHGILVELSNGRLRFLHRNLSPESGDNDFHTLETNHNDNKWHHVAAVRDGQSMRLYVDGVEKINQSSDPKNFDKTLDVVIGKLDKLRSERYFKGELANYRVYNRALSLAEIKQCMETDETALSAFRATHPLEFELYNQQDEAVLYITDAADQTLTLQLTNTSDRVIAFQAKEGDVASQDHYHLQLRFRPNTLSRQSQERLNALKQAIKSNDASAITQLQSAGFEPADWSLNYGFDQKDQTEWISLLWIKAGQEFNFPQKAVQTLKIPFLSAAAAGGARGTRVYLKYANLSIPAGERSHYLNILNRQGKQYIPLHVGFVGSNTILNDGTPNELTLRITNLSEQPLPLQSADPSVSPEFWVYFDYQSTNLSSSGRTLTDAGLTLDAWEKEWVIGTNGIAQSIEINPTGDDRKEWEDPGAAKDLQTDRPYWILKPKQSKTALLPRETVEFYISKISTSAPTGYTNLYVEYKNIPGYWDGRFICLIEKGPLVYRQIPQLDPNQPIPQAKFVNVGIGTDEPKAKLHVSVAKENNAGADKQPAAMFMGGGVGIGVKPGADDTLKVQGNTILDGNVEIGTVPGTERLKVKGDAAITGSLSVTDVTTLMGKVGIGIAPGDEQLKVQGNTAINRLNISEQTGTSHSSSAGTIVIDHENNGGASSIVFRSKVNRSSDYGFIQYQDASSVGVENEQARLIIGTQNDADDHLLLMPSGNIGINITNPAEKLHIKDGSLRIDSGEIKSWGPITLTPDVDNTGDKEVIVNGKLTVNGEIWSTLGGIMVPAQRMRTFAGSNKNPIWGPSDIQLKENIAFISSALSQLEKLKPVSFHWQDINYFLDKFDQDLPSFSILNEQEQAEISQERAALQDRLEKQQFGFIAQDLEQVFPDWVRAGEDGYKQINLKMLPPFLVQAIQELKQKCDELALENEKLNDRLTVSEAQSNHRRKTANS